jgi:hypothetical protein
MCSVNMSVVAFPEHAEHDSLSQIGMFILRRIDILRNPWHLSPSKYYGRSIKLPIWSIIEHGRLLTAPHPQGIAHDLKPSYRI